MQKKTKWCLGITISVLVVSAVALKSEFFSESASPVPESPTAADPRRTLYPAAKIFPSAPQATQDDATLKFYKSWKSSFIRRDCGDDSYQVSSPDAAYPYVAEAQGYGMAITSAMYKSDPQARTIFDGILAFVLSHPSVNDPDLTAAEQDQECSNAGGGNSATDGDMDIAYALLVADKVWGSAGRYDYRALALRRITAIKMKEVNPKTRLMLLGDWSTARDPKLYNGSRTSDWIVHHFRAFEKVTGDSEWGRIRQAHQNAISELQTEFSPNTGLLPDFVQTPAQGPTPAVGKLIESPHDGHYNFNACRTPWRIGLDAITSGDKTSMGAAIKINQWFKSITGGDPDKIGAGYTLDGERYGAEGAKPFWAPLAVTAMTDAGSQTWLDALWAKMSASDVDPDNYYGATVQLQVMLVVSGNYTPL